MRELYILHCSQCYVMFGIPDAMDNRLRQNGKPFYCPNGHAEAYNYGKSKADRLAEELSRERQRLAQKDDEIKALQEREARILRQTRTLEIEKRRLEKRAKAGLCPCCNRSFDALARHMKTKHPQFVADNPVPKATAKVLQLTHRKTSK
jgi:hypothetical protein